MLDQSYSLDYCFFWFHGYFRRRFVPRIVFFNLCFKFPKNLMLSIVDKVTIRALSLTLFIWYVGAYCVGGNGQ